jgi:diguanylate cyclase (GGDEF)-like protein
MAILIVDDSPTTLSITKSYLNEAGYNKLLLAESAGDAFNKLGINLPEGSSRDEASSGIDLILLDIVLPDMDGREACSIIKSVELLQDIPIIIVTSLTETEHLERAFSAGATDYITKPINKIELLSRIRAALKLKHEMDRRKLREKKLLEVTRELEKAVTKLNRLSSLDGLTCIANRRSFDEHLDSEWKRCRRNARPLSLIMADIDYFKAYNDTYGHQAGDECLKSVALALDTALNRPGDLTCRYGGEEFAVVLPETNKKGAIHIANTLSQSVGSLHILHKNSPLGGKVTVSMGVASVLPTKDLSHADLVAAADKALYKAKQEGRNRIRTFSVDSVVQEPASPCSQS